MSWLLRAFFAGTVAFKVPSYTIFMDPKVIGMGFLFFIPIIGKLSTGFYAQPFNFFNFFKVITSLFWLSYTRIKDSDLKHRWVLQCLLGEKSHLLLQQLLETPI